MKLILRFSWLQKVHSSWLRVRTRREPSRDNRLSCKCDSIFPDASYASRRRSLAPLRTQSRLSNARSNIWQRRCSSLYDGRQCFYGQITVLYLNFCSILLSAIQYKNKSVSLIHVHVYLQIDVSCIYGNSSLREKS